MVIADVCDKGLGAALFMTLFRSLIRAVASIDCLAHAESAGKLSCATRLKNAISITNDYIAETHGKTGMFATVFFGILDTRTGALKYINGGHLPPLIVGHQGIRQILSLTGPAIGMIAHAAYGVGEVTVECGDTLFAYTDGLTDTTNAAGEYFSQQAFIPLLAGGQTLSTLLAQIEKQVEGYAAGAHQIDDITMLAVRRRDG